MKGLWRYLILFAMPGFLLAVAMGSAVEPLPGLLDGTLPVKLFAGVLTVLFSALIGSIGSSWARRHGWDYFAHTAVCGGLGILVSAQNALWPWPTPTLQALAALMSAGVGWGWMAAVVTDRKRVTVREAWCWVLAAAGGGWWWFNLYSLRIIPYCGTMIHWITWCCMIGWLIASPLTRKGRKNRIFWVVWLGSMAGLGYFFPPFFLPPPAQAVLAEKEGQGWYWLGPSLLPNDVQHQFGRKDGGRMTTDSRGRLLQTDPADAALADTALPALLETSGKDEFPSVLFLGSNGSRWAEMVLQCGYVKRLWIYETVSSANREITDQLRLLIGKEDLLWPKARYQLVTMLRPPQSADHLQNRKNLLTTFQNVLDPQGVLVVPTALAESPEWRPLLETLWPHQAFLPGNQAKAFSGRNLDFSFTALERKNQQFAECGSGDVPQGVLALLYDLPAETAPAAGSSEPFPEPFWKLPEYDWCAASDRQRFWWLWGLLAALLAERGIASLSRRRRQSQHTWQTLQAGMLCGWVLGTVLMAKTGEPLFGNQEIWLALLLTVAAWLPMGRKVPLRLFTLLWLWGAWQWYSRSVSGIMTSRDGALIAGGAALLAGGMAARLTDAKPVASPLFFSGTLIGCLGVIAALIGQAPWWFFAGIGAILTLRLFEKNERFPQNEPIPEGEMEK